MTQTTCKHCGTKPTGLPNPQTWNYNEKCYSCYSYSYRMTSQKTGWDKPVKTKNDKPKRKKRVKPTADEIAMWNNYF